jgi:Carbohydrate family 9 binding domain-like
VLKINGERSKMTENRQTKITIQFLEKDFSINEFDNENWEKAQEISIEKYWSGENAPAGRWAKARLLWSENALYVRFEAVQTEPLIISEKPNLKTKTHGLWEMDVCEIFVAPERDEPRKYFEFEIAPSGEWIDLAIHQMPERRETDFAYDSGMRSQAVIEKDKIRMAIKIEWKAFGKTPEANDVWRGNLFRCVGAGATRGYLAWQPTGTMQPSFHVPEAFGEFKFTG